MGHDDKLRPSLTPRTPPNGEAPLGKPHPVVFLSVTNLVIIWDSTGNMEGV